MDFEIIIAFTKNVLWLILLGWSLFRFFRYSETKYPKPDSCSRRDYKSWRGMEATALQLAVIGTICSVIFTLVMRPKNSDAYVKFEAIRSIFWIMGAIAIPMIQSLAKGRAKKLRIL